MQITIMNKLTLTIRRIYLGGPFVFLLLIPVQTYSNNPADRGVAQSLINNAQAKKSSGAALTQSQAHLTVPFVQSKVQELEWLSKNETLLNAIIKKEEEHQGYCCFYTAIPSSYVILQDVTRKLYKQKAGRVGGLASGKKAFQFVRYAYQSPSYNAYQNVTAFLMKEFKQEGIIDDNVSHLKTILVSTNLAILGDVGLPGESTYNYFNTPQAWAAPSKLFMDQCLRSFGYSTQYANELLAAAEIIKSSNGTIFQYFIPPSIINNIGYKSWRQGIPFDKNFIEQLFNKENMTFGRSDLIFKAEIDKAISAWKQKYAQKDPATVEAVLSMLTRIARGDFHLYPFLEEYKKNPIGLIHTNFFQARLLVTNEFLLNPASGILVYRYMYVNPDAQKAYKLKLKEILSRMIAGK